MQFYRSRDRDGGSLIALVAPSFAARAGVAFLALSLGASAQTLEQTQQEFLGGHYEAVIQTARTNLDGAYSEAWRGLLIKSLMTVGHYAEAATNALAGVDEFPRSIQLRLLAREAALFQNDPAGASRQLNGIRYLIERRGLEDQTGENLVALGRALLLLGIEPRLALENCFQRAAAMDPPVREAYLASGQLALDKHDFKLAADTFRAGLKKFPNDPDMEAGLGQAFETGDRQEMLKALQAALAANPRHIPSLLLLADPFH